ncbi:transcriptional regulator [Sphingobium sp. Ant17]|nr:transcriptional regulator [Sphingobium sp. Ant17]
MAAAKDTDGRTGRDGGHGRDQSSTVSATASVCLARQASSRSASAGSLVARMAAASSPALIAPGLPIASVATGMPPGIWTIESSESMPLSAFDSTGTPSTGSRVIDAHMPGKCAAPPAPAMMTFRPRLTAPVA